MDLILLSMELFGKPVQYESGSDAGWLIVPVFHTFPCTSLTNPGCTGSNSMVDPLEALGCLLSSASQILEVSRLFPTADGSWDSEDLGFLPVKASNGDGRLEPMGVVLYYMKP